MQLVLIDCKTNHYSYYEGRTKVHEIVSDRPLDKTYVEQFRSSARSMMDDFDGEDPDGDLIA